MRRIKLCSTCKKYKPLSEFYKNKHKKDGHANDCKECHKKYKQNENCFRSWSARTLNSHKHKGYLINVSIDELYKLSVETKICKYCGKTLSYDFGNKGTSRDFSPSLDRINNEKELNINNIQIICYDCNATKRGRTHDEFVEYCEMIAKKFNYFARLAQVG